MDPEKNNTKEINAPFWFEVFWYVLLMFLVGEILIPIFVETKDNSTNIAFYYASYFFSGIIITLLIRLYKKGINRIKAK